MEKPHKGGKSPEEAVWMDRRMEEVEAKVQAPDHFTHGINKTAGSRHRPFGEKQNLLPLTVLETRFLSLPARSPVSVRTPPISLSLAIFLFVLYNVRHYLNVQFVRDRHG
jgi:hypothetical protein